MHRLLNRYRLQAKDFRPKGGGSIIARAALKNLAASSPAPVRTFGGRDFSRTAIREVEARRPEYVAPALPAPADRFDQSDVVARPSSERTYAPHHRPAYQSDLGHAALHALAQRKIAG
ncbi:MAG TPA: hypothetical protein VMZ53_27335 [Kofleriaceae bacterium]|nr:hypothetical protein [Kofleriaceae bacterium]